MERLIDVLFSKSVALPLFVLSVCSAVVLFASDQFLTRLGLLEFRNAQRVWIGPSFLVSTVWWLAVGAGQIFHGAGGVLSRRAAKRASIERLQNLTYAERMVLREFLADGSRSIVLPCEQPAVMSLIAEGMIWRPGQLVQRRLNHSGSGPPITIPAVHHIHDFVWDYLHLHPEALAIEERTED